MDLKMIVICCGKNLTTVRICRSVGGHAVASGRGESLG